VQIHPPTALPRNPTGNSSPSVGVLSALEAVRQTWLKEEEVKMFDGSRLPSDPGSTTRTSLAMASSSSSSGSSSSRRSTAGQHSLRLQSLEGSTPGKELGPGSSAAAALSALGRGGGAGDAGFEGRANAGSWSMSGSSSGMPSTCPNDDLHQADVRRELLLSCGGYVLPLVPALRLSETSSSIPQVTRSGSAGTTRRLGSRSARGHGTVTAGSSSDRPSRAADRAKVARSSSTRAPGLLPPVEPSGPGVTAAASELISPGRTTAVQWAPMPYNNAVAGQDISSRDKYTPAAARPSSSSGCLLLAAPLEPTETSTAPGASSPSARDRLHDAQASATPAHTAPGEGIFRDRASLSMRTESLARRQLSKGRAGPSMVPPPPLLLLTDADDVADELCGVDTAAISPAAVGSTAAVCLCGSTSGQSSPELCSSSTGRVCSPSPCSTARGPGASPDTAGGVGACDPRGAVATPMALEHGGKINAMLMRQLNKKQSLMRLEEVMLMVASQVEGAVQLSAAATCP